MAVTMSKPNDSRQMLATAVRRAEIMQYAVAGQSNYEEIAQAMLKKHGVTLLPRGFDRRYVFKDIQRELERVNEDMGEDTLKYKLLQTQRLDAMLTAMLPKALRGDYGAVDRVLRIEDRRAKLWGLDSPTKVAPVTPDGKESYQPLNLENLTDAELERLGSIFAKITPQL